MEDLTQAREQGWAGFLYFYPIPSVAIYMPAFYGPAAVGIGAAKLAGAGPFAAVAAALRQAGYVPEGEPAGGDLSGLVTRVASRVPTARRPLRPLLFDRHCGPEAWQEPREVAAGHTIARAPT